MSQWWPLLPEFVYFAGRGLVRRQKLVLKPTFSFASQFTLTQDDKKRWQQLFGATDNNSCFLYHWPQFIRFFLRTMNTTGLALKNIRHLGQDIKIHGHGSGWPPGSYKVSSHVQHFYKRRAGQIMCHTRSQLMTSADEGILSSDDYSVILNVSNKNYHQLQDQLAEMPTDLNQRFSNLKNKGSSLHAETTHRLQLRLKPNTGVQYGMVSGDMNPIHSYKAVAKIVGIRSPFIQGTWITNYMLHQLAEKNSQKKLGHLSITYCNPLFMDKDYELCLSSDQFEIISANNGKMAAFGSYS